MLPPPGPFHRFENRLHSQEHADLVYIDDLAVFGLADVLDGGKPGDAGIVDQNGNGSEHGFRSGDGGIPIRFRTNMEPSINRACADLGSDGPARLIGDIGNHDLGAFSGKQLRNRLPDAPTATGHDGDLARYSAHAISPCPPLPLPCSREPTPRIHCAVKPPSTARVAPVT